MSKRLWVALMALGLANSASVFAEVPANSIAISLDPYPVDVESPSGTNGEKHRPRLGLEVSRTITRHIDLLLAGGYHRIDVETAGAATQREHFFDVRLGGRIYLIDRQVSTWTPFIDLAASQGWVQNSNTGVAGNRRYTGWNGQLGLARLISETTDLRFSVGYTRLRADEPNGTAFDELSTGNMSFAAAMRF